MRACLRVHVISRKAIVEFVAAGHADAEVPLSVWFNVTEKATWSSIADVRLVYRDTDPVGKFTVFDIKGNDDRLIAEIFYEEQELLIRHIMTHAEYDKGSWK